MVYTIHHVDDERDVSLIERWISIKHATTLKKPKTHRDTQRHTETHRDTQRHTETGRQINNEEWKHTSYFQDRLWRILLKFISNFNDSFISNILIPWSPKHKHTMLKRHPQSLVHSLSIINHKWTFDQHGREITTVGWTIGHSPRRRNSIRVPFISNISPILFAPSSWIRQPIIHSFKVDDTNMRFQPVNKKRGRMQATSGQNTPLRFKIFNEAFFSNPSAIRMAPSSPIAWFPAVHHTTTRTPSISHTQWSFTLFGWTSSTK